MKLMGKRMAALLLALLLTLAMCACSEKQEENEAPADTDKTEETDGFYVTYNGTRIELGVSADAVLKKLGDANSAQEVFDCGEGNSRMYYRYASFDLYTMKSDGKEVIDQIELIDDLSQTEKGISIGSKESALRDAYGEPSSEADGELTYAKDDQRLIFELTDGKVSAIGLLRVTQ